MSRLIKLSLHMIDSCITVGGRCFLSWSSKFFSCSPMCWGRSTETEQPVCPPHSHALADLCSAHIKSSKTPQCCFVEWKRPGRKIDKKVSSAVTYSVPLVQFSAYVCVSPKCSPSILCIITTSSNERIGRVQQLLGFNLSKPHVVSCSTCLSNPRDRSIPPPLLRWYSF